MKIWKVLFSTLCIVSLLAICCFVLAAPALLADETNNLWWALMYAPYLYLIVCACSDNS